MFFVCVSLGGVDIDPQHRHQEHGLVLLGAELPVAGRGRGQRHQQPRFDQAKSRPGRQRAAGRRPAQQIR